MKTKFSDVETLYDRVLKKCIEQLEKLNDIEASKLSIIIEMGREIDNLISSVEDKESLFKRLSRDISKSRKKLIDYTKLETYHQLYLFYDSPETLSQAVNTLSCDVSAELLENMMKKGQGAGKGYNGENRQDDVLQILDRIKKMIIKSEMILDEHPLDESSKATAHIKIASIQEKLKSLIDLTNNCNGSRQQPLFPTERISK